MTHDDLKLVHIAVVDWKGVDHVRVLFQRAGIRGVLPGGSRGCAVEVPPDAAARAVQLLRENSQAHEYWVGFPDAA
jgi:hypothetical protein